MRGPRTPHGERLKATATLGVGGGVVVAGKRKQPYCGDHVSHNRKGDFVKQRNILGVHEHWLFRSCSAVKGSVGGQR